MKYLSLYFLFFLLIGCVSYNYHQLVESKDIVKEKCFSCHAPQVRLEAMPLDSMYISYGKRNLSKYLKGEISYNAKQIKPHPHISLSRKEMKLILVYLEEYKDGVYH